MDYHPGEGDRDKNLAQVPRSAHHLLRQSGVETPPALIDYERHHPRWRSWDKALSVNLGSVQAVDAGLRQANDLLSVEHPDAGRNQRDPGDLYPSRPIPL